MTLFINVLTKKQTECNLLTKFIHSSEMKKIIFFNEAGY